jgi:hypothetical protein
MKYELNDKLMNMVLNYLGSKPYLEVKELIEKILKEAVVVAEKLPENASEK